RRGAIAGDDPWHGETLEWATSSPPPEYNFESIPQVRSREPTWDQPELRDGAQPPSEGSRSLDTGHLQLSTSTLDASPEAAFSMPHESPWPFVLAVAITVGFFGLLLNTPLLAVAGLAGCFVGICGWVWPRGEP